MHIIVMVPPVRVESTLHEAEVHRSLFGTQVQISRSSPYSPKSFEARFAAAIKFRFYPLARWHLAASAGRSRGCPHFASCSNASPTAHIIYACSANDTAST